MIWFIFPTANFRKIVWVWFLGNFQDILSCAFLTRSHIQRNLFCHFLMSHSYKRTFWGSPTWPSFSTRASNVWVVNRMYLKLALLSLIISGFCIQHWFDGIHHCILIFFFRPQIRHLWILSWDHLQLFCIVQTISKTVLFSPSACLP